jgi:hypothetical protein
MTENRVDKFTRPVTYYGLLTHVEMLHLIPRSLSEQLRDKIVPNYYLAS